MVRTTMIRISQKSLPIERLEDLYSALEGQEITIKRMFDKRFSLSGDDLVIEGNIDGILQNLSFQIPRLVSVRFQVDEGDYEKILENCAAINLIQNNHKYFFGITLVDYEYLYDRIRVREKEKILAILFRSLLGSKFTCLMPVKVKGLAALNLIDNTISFVLPTQRIETLKSWLYAKITKEKVNFDTLIDVFRKTDPQMRKRLDETIEWINGILPEIVAKSTTFEEIDILKAYKKSFALI